MRRGRERRAVRRAPWTVGAPAVAVALVALVVLGTALAPAGPAAASVRHRPTSSRTGALRPAAAVARGPDALRLLAQTPAVGPKTTVFRLRLQVTARSPSTEALGFTAYGALTARSQFQAARDGTALTPFIYQLPQPVALSKLPRDRAGGVDLDIPVNTAGGLPVSATGVYPVQVFLESYGALVGKPLTTFLVYAGADAAGYHRLEVATVVDLGGDGTPAARPGRGGAAAASLSAQTVSPRVIEADASVLATERVPATLQVSPAEVAAMAGGSAPERSAVSDLRSALGSGDELLPATSVPTDTGALVSAGLEPDLQSLLLQGSTSLAGTLGTAPALSTWVSVSDLAPSTVGALGRAGVQQLVLPGDNLSVPPSDTLGLTFGQPAKLAAAGSSFSVVGSDPELAGQLQRATTRGQTALVVNQLLAELAMIDLERPGDLRGVVLMAPPGTVLGPDVLLTLLAGLEHDPLLKAVTVDGEFDSVPLAAQGGQTLTRHLVGARQPEALAGVGLLQAAEREVGAYSEVFGRRSGLFASFSQRLLESLSSSLSPAQRSTSIAAVLRSASAQLDKVRLPTPEPITLTSLNGQLPLTLLSSAVGAARVTLVLSSEELSFVQRRYPEGECRPTGPGSAECALTLTHASTVFEVPISVRTPGVFQLLLQLETRSGAVVLATSTQTVRSTAFPDVGLVVIIAAALFLLVWWLRNARHGRRARQLVPRPVDDDDTDDTQPAVSSGAPPRAPA